jgi:hypothetical protein
MLHGTVEDTNTTPDELEERFGYGVRSLVLEITDDKSLAKEDRIPSVSRANYKYISGFHRDDSCALRGRRIKRRGIDTYNTTPLTGIGLIAIALARLFEQASSAVIPAVSSLPRLDEMP